MHSPSERWKDAAERLGVSVIAPFTLELDGACSAFDALLPQFGDRAGIVVHSNWSTIEPFASALIDAGYSYSCVTLGTNSEEASLIQMLMDWRWNGVGDKPAWL